MDASRAPQAEAPPNRLEDRLGTVGTELRSALEAVLAALPGAPHRPGRLAQELGVNRAVASKILGAIGKRHPLEVLHRVPGPVPLQKLVRTCAQMGVPRELVEAAERAIGRFDRLIRTEAGNRPALDALISSSLPGARERFEMASKYAVYKGLAHLKGVQAEHWLSTAVLFPARDDPTKHDLTWLTGAVAMQRLRPGVTVRFSYRQGVDGKIGGGSSPPGLGVLPLEQFCVHPPARLESHMTGGTIHYTLPDDLVGPREAVDMFVVDHHPASVRRTSAGPAGRRTSFFAEPAIPVASMTLDVLLHREAFPGADPELVVYDTGYDGIADVNDRARDIDRVPLAESVEVLGRPLGELQVSEVPNYGPMLLHLGERFGWKPGEFRGYRTRIAYPVYGWQVCMTFEPPAQGDRPRHDS